MNSDFTINYFCASTDLGSDITRSVVVKAKNWRRAVSRLRRQTAVKGKDMYDIYVVSVLNPDGTKVFDIEKDYLITGDSGFPFEDDTIMVEASNFQEIAETIVKYGYPPFNKNLCVARGLASEDSIICNTYGPYLDQCCNDETRDALLKILIPLQLKKENEAFKRAAVDMEK